MTEQWTDDITGLSDWAFMKIYSSPYNHNRALRARLDQEALKTGYRPNGAGGPGRIEAESERRGLVYPDSWIEAGIIDPAGE